MHPREHHVMQAELDAEQGTMRYTCPRCRRCVEDGPDGIKIVHRGDLEAVHQGGSLAGPSLEIESEPAAPPPVLH
jgi:hypothetical protein